MVYDPSSDIQDYLIFGEFGGVNPSITDSSTFTFLSPEKMQEAFEHEMEGCFLYSRHWNPINKVLAGALSRLEGSEDGLVTASGMAAISAALMQLCGQGDEIIAHRTIYGGTWALLKNFLPRFGITVRYVNILDLEAVKAAITTHTKVIYCESMSNPLLEVADLPSLSRIADQHALKLVVDNTFSPLLISPAKLGAHVVVNSLTKFINGTSDCVAGNICSSHDFIAQLTDVNAGASMLLGPVLDSFRAASILKNLHTLHIRMQKHSINTKYLAERLEARGIKVYYPGLPSHPQHDFLTQIMNPGFGYGGMIAFDVGDAQTANRLMAEMQKENVGYLAVSLGYFKTLFSAPSQSTSSEIPADEQKAAGLRGGLIRMSVGIDNDMERSYKRIEKCFQTLKLF